ncbi:MAG: GspH/FimT family protein [Gemmatimonadaceae bacterium]|nr:GspH/FimT family protein [Gemmatimonadaceae bacterium]
MIELAITLGVAAILAALALPAIDFNRYRMDANARLVQNTLLWAQTRAVQRNMDVLVQFDYDRSRFRIVDDSTGDGAFTSGEVESYRQLAEGMRFAIPPSTIDGQTRAYATGAGITVPGYPTIVFHPNGSSSGDAVIYLGSPRGRTQDYRAVKVTASTAKMTTYRMRSDGAWSRSEL